MQTIGADWSLLDYLKHLALPATILALRLTAILMRFARSSFLEVFRQDYITVAEAKGLPQRVVILRHAAKNAVIPLITVIGLQLPLLFGGSFIIETIFAWPGMGKLLYDAIFQRDYPVVMGVTLIIGIVILLSNLAADVAYAYADPRIRYE
jgi:peptide/nickel transport system permease protein